MHAPADRAAAAARARRGWRQAIRRLRKLRRWSQDRLALELQAASRTADCPIPQQRAHVRRTIQHWEAGDTLPGEDYAVLLVVVFARPGELKRGAVLAGSELARLLDALAVVGYGPEQRGLVLSLAALAVTGRDTFEVGSLARAGGQPAVAAGPGWEEAGAVPLPAVAASGVVPPVGVVLRDYRAARGLTQGALAELLDLDRTYVCRVEAGTRQLRDIGLLVQIARRLGVAPDRLGLSDALVFGETASAGQIAASRS